MKWVLVRFNDGILSHVLKWSHIETEEGISGDEANLVVGSNCLAPWQGDMYHGKLICISGIEIIMSN